jgi:hypothetical protein
MDDYIGLDVSMKETAVSIRRGGQRVWRGKCPSDPRLIADLIRKRAPSVKRVVFETGPLSGCWVTLAKVRAELAGRGSGAATILIQSPACHRPRILMACRTPI